MGTMLMPGWGTAIGGVAGGAMGALGGLGQASAEKAARRAQKAQEAAIRAEMRRRAEGIGKARETFGDISSYGQAFSGGLGPAAAQDPSTHQDIGKTLNARANIQGQIDTEASAALDAGRQDLTSSTQQAAAGVRQAAASRGLMGSSIDTGAKTALLGGLAGGKSNLAASVDAVKRGGWNAVNSSQQGFEAAAGGGNISPQMGSLSTASLAAGARGQMGTAMLGNMVGQGLGVLRHGALAEAQGGQGLRALGLPSLGLSTSPTRRSV